MKFTFTEKKMGTSEELRSYTERKVGKLDRFFKTESSANITFSMERGRFLAEITVSNNGLYYRASEPTATPMPMPTRKFVLVIVYTSEIYYDHFCFATAL